MNEIKKFKCSSTKCYLGQLPSTKKGKVGCEALSCSRIEALGTGFQRRPGSEQRHSPHIPYWTGMLATLASALLTRPQPTVMLPLLPLMSIRNSRHAGKIQQALLTFNNKNIQSWNNTLNRRSFNRHQSKFWKGSTDPTKVRYKSHHASRSPRKWTISQTVGRMHLNQPPSNKELRKCWEDPIDAAKLQHNTTENQQVHWGVLAKCIKRCLGASREAATVGMQILHHGAGFCGFISFILAHEPP